LTYEQGAEKGEKPLKDEIPSTKRSTPHAASVRHNWRVFHHDR
jgi:hypothetical protein